MRKNKIVTKKVVVLIATLLLTAVIVSIFAGKRSNASELKTFNDFINVLEEEPNFPNEPYKENIPKTIKEQLEKSKEKRINYKIGKSNFEVWKIDNEYFVSITGNNIHGNDLLTGTLQNVAIYKSNNSIVIYGYQNMKTYKYIYYDGDFVEKNIVNGLNLYGSKHKDAKQIISYPDTDVAIVEKDIFLYHNGKQLAKTHLSEPVKEFCNDYLLTESGTMYYMYISCSVPKIVLLKVAENVEKVSNYRMKIDNYNEIVIFIKNKKPYIALPENIKKHCYHTKWTTTVEKECPLEQVNIDKTIELKDEMFDKGVIEITNNCYNLEVYYVRYYINKNNTNNSNNEVLKNAYIELEQSEQKELVEILANNVSAMDVIRK